MLKNVFTALGLMLSLAAGQSCFASISVSLSSSPAGPVVLSVGQSATFTVNIHDVLATSPTGIDYLSVTVLFDATQLGTPTSITPGGIVPTTNPGLSFFDVAPGNANAFYDGMFGAFDQIQSDGAFFSFEVTALNPGTTQVWFDYVTVYDSTNVDILDPSPPLLIDVTVNGISGVPEPSSWAIFSLGLGAFGFVLARRRFGATEK